MRLFGEYLLTCLADATDERPPKPPSLMRSIFRKSLVVFAALIASIPAFCQIGAGAGFVNINHRYSEGDNVSLNGFYVGGSYDVGFYSDNIRLTPGVYFSVVTKTIDSESDKIRASSDHLWREQCILVPVLLSYGDDIGPNVRLFGYAGPVASIGISSRYASTDLYDSVSKRFDVKGSVGAGVDILGMVRVLAGYDFGMLDQSKTDVKERVNIFHIGAAYLF